MSTFSQPNVATVAAAPEEETLTPQQKAARTRAANRAAKLAESNN